MRNPSRRNRNIGTSKQGFGNNNRFDIPETSSTKSFVEQIENYSKEYRTINGHQFTFIIEQTRTTSRHACSINDIERMLNFIPSKDYGELEHIVFRQPKRKEEIHSPVWGRLLYSFDFEGEFAPAIILEAVDYQKFFKCTKKLSVESQIEIDRLRQDGHELIEEKRFFRAEYKIENVRNTQLYRTLLHEFGHYVHYLEVVERPGTDGEDIEEWEKRHDSYFRIPKSEKEKYAHKYADRIREELIGKRLIPFNSL